jgi:hypothetical protein
LTKLERQVLASVVDIGTLISVGERMRRLLKLINTKSAEEMKNRIEFIGAWSDIRR